MSLSRDIFTGVTMALPSLASFTAVASMWQLAGMDFAAVYTAGILFSLVGTWWLAFHGCEAVLMPSAVVSGYLVFIAVISHGLGWQTAFGICFLASLLGMLLCRWGIPLFRKGLPAFFPWGIKLALAVFLLCMGLKMGRIVITSSWQVTMLGDAADPLMYWSLAGIVLTLALWAGGWRGALFGGMAVTGVITFGEGFWVIPTAPFFLPEGLEKVIGQLSFTLGSAKETVFFWITVLSLAVMLGSIHGSTLTAFSRDGKPADRFKHLFALGTLGALCGVAPLVIMPASAAIGEAEKGRRAILSASAVLVLALFCEPLIAAIADFPALVVPVVTGSGFFLLLEALEHCPLAGERQVRRAELLAVSVLVLLLSLTGNFATALGASFLGYALFMTMAGRARQVTGVIWLLSGIFALYFIYGSVF